MGNIFQGKVESPQVNGYTTINHEARVELGMTCSEYVLMDHIYSEIKKGNLLDMGKTHGRTGFNDFEQGQILKKLVQKGFVLPIEQNPPVITDKWISAFKDIDTEFEEYFWKRKGKVFWPGSKKKAKERYIALRKKYPKDFLVNQRDHYAKFLHYTRTNGFDRDTMVAERWLNPSNEYYLSDWKMAWEEVEQKLIKKGIFRKPKDSNVKPLTDKERKERYAKDSDQ